MLLLRSARRKMNFSIKYWILRLWKLPWIIYNEKVRILKAPLSSIKNCYSMFGSQTGAVGSDRTSQFNHLKTIWFTLFSRGMGKVGSCGFEHVFMNEIKNNKVSGLHNWIYFHEQELDSHHDVDYKGYLKSLHLGNVMFYYWFSQLSWILMVSFVLFFQKAQLIKYRLGYRNINKPVNTMFIGTLPEFEMALYTVCFTMRKTKCDVSLAGKSLSIRSYPFFYNGNRLIGSAYPEF